MAETSGFFDAVKLADGTYDRSYIAEQFANYFKLFIGNGVFASPTDQCKVVAGSGLNVVVKAGWAFINGYWYHNDTDLTLPIVANTTASSRTDMVILRFDSSSRTIVAQVALGTTTVDRTTHYDLKLAEIVVGTGVSEIVTANITDKRADETVCGFVTGLLNVISTSDLFNQYQSMFNTWFDSVKGQLTTDAAGAIYEKINPHDIASNTDLNTIIDNGYYVCQADIAALTLLNCPTPHAFEMEARRLDLNPGNANRYLHQIIRALDSDKMFIRLISSNGKGVFVYGPWRTYTSSPFGNVFYGTCSTAAATAAKVVSATDFFLSTGVEITVKNTIANTATAPTLNVNGTGAKSIYYHGAAVPAGYFGVGTYKLSYDGSVYNIIEDASVTTINSNLGGLTFAQSTNGKWGYKVAGADPVIPFKSYYDLGVGTSFNVTTYQGYQNFTVDNFICQPSNISNRSARIGDLSGVEYGTCSGVMNKTYTSSSGILSAYYTVSGGFTYDHQNNSYTTSVNASVHAYLIV